MASILKIGISHNTKCDNLVGFPKSGHICAYVLSNASSFVDNYSQSSTFCSSDQSLFLFEVIRCATVLVWRWYVLQVVLNCSVLSALEHLCKSNHEAIRKEACWTVSNIAAGNKVQIQVSTILLQCFKLT